MATSKKKAPAKKKTPAKKKPFDKKVLDAQKALLLEERGRYVRSAESLRAEADALIEGREPGDVQFDEEGGEEVARKRDQAHDDRSQNGVTSHAGWEDTMWKERPQKPNRQ